MFCVSSDTEITDKIEQQMLEKIDMSEIEKYSKDYLPDRLSFADIVDAIKRREIKRRKKSVSIFMSCFYEIAVEVIYKCAVLYDTFYGVFKAYFLAAGLCIQCFCLCMHRLYQCLWHLFLCCLMWQRAVLMCFDLSYSACAGNICDSTSCVRKRIFGIRFYMLAFVLIYVVEWLIKLVLIPGIHLFLVLEVLNHVSSEKKLEKLAEFIESAVTKIMKASIKIVAGIGIVQAMIAPAKDKISESLILKSFQAIPGVGRLGQGAGEIMLGCAMLIKNSVGMAAIIVLFFIVLTPLVKTLIFSLMYRLLSAALQPVSDNRIVEGIEAVARAGNLYYIVIRDASILFFIVIAIVCASTSFMGG